MRRERTKQNAMKRPEQAELNRYAHMLTSMTRAKLAKHLGVAVSTTYRWIPPPGRVICPRCDGRGGLNYPPGNWVDCSICEGRRHLDADDAKARWEAVRNRIAAEELSRSRERLSDEMIEAIRSGIGGEQGPRIVVDAANDRVDVYAVDESCSPGPDAMQPWGW